MLNEIITVYLIIDNLPFAEKGLVGAASRREEKAIRHNEDRRRNMNDAEIITTSVRAAMFFNGNHQYCLRVYERP